jgi:hypothetical protein
VPADAADRADAIELHSGIWMYGCGGALFDCELVSKEPENEPHCTDGQPVPSALAQRMARLVPPTMTPPVLFRAVARNGPTGLLDRRWLDSALREALILRVCTACGNDYEWRLQWR